MMLPFMYPYKMKLKYIAIVLLAMILFCTSISYHETSRRQREL